MSVERVERKGGYVWRVRWRDEQGRACSKVVGRKRDADAFEAEIVRRKRTGDLDLLTGGRETLADFAEEWWRLYAVPSLAARTLRSYAGLWDRHVLPRLGSMRPVQSRPRLSSATGLNWKPTAWGSRRSTGRSRFFRVSCGGRSSGGASATTRSRWCRSRRSVVSGRYAATAAFYRRAAANRRCQEA